jgi:hypothetical protein
MFGDSRIAIIASSDPRIITITLLTLLIDDEACGFDWNCCRMSNCEQAVLFLQVLITELATFEILQLEERVMNVSFGER